MQEFRLWQFVPFDVSSGVRQKRSELSIITKSITTSIVLQHTQHRVATAMQHPTQSAMTVAMIQYSVVNRDRELADGTQPSLHRSHFNPDRCELRVL